MSLGNSSRSGDTSQGGEGANGSGDGNGSGESNGNGDHDVDNSNDENVGNDNDSDDRRRLRHDDAGPVESEPLMNEVRLAHEKGKYFPFCTS
jgi:hypothetical protein